MATSANALYVLRLVLGGVRRRAFAPSSTRAFSDFNSAPGYAEPPSFLEADEGEYAEAAEFLPDREATESPPVPWPTVFSHGAPRPHRSQPCDIVARLVASNKLSAARKVVDELAALHTPVQHRKIYLGPAIACLQPTDEGRRDFLFWMGLYPARGATPNLIPLRREWEPIAHRILAESIDDAAFLTDFLELAGRKGLLNVILPIFVAPITAILPPHESEAAIARAIASYRATCRPKSTSSLGRTLAALTDSQTGIWWNKYLRALAIAEYHDNAIALLHSPPSGVRFDSWTRAMVLGEDMTKQRRADVAMAHQYGLMKKAKRADALAALIDDPPPSRRMLAKYLARVLDRTQRDLPPVSELADTQRLLLQERPELLGALYRKFTAHIGDGPVRGSSVRHAWWAHAEMLRHARAGDHAEAVRTFRRRFLWVGLPPTSVGGVDASRAPRRLPNKRIICSLIPSILAPMSPAERAAYRAAYYAPSRRLSPSLKPNQYTHLAFVRAETLAGGPTAAMEVVQNIVEVGMDPGLPAWSALLLSLMGRGDVDAALHLLDSMERRAPFGTETRRMPAPSGRTYAGLVRIAVKHGRIGVAADLMRRYQKHAELVDGELESIEGFLAHEKRRDRTPEEIAVEKRNQGSLIRELDRLEGDDVKPRIRMLFERQRRKGGKEKEGEEKEDEEKGDKVTDENGGEEKVMGEQGEEDKSAFA